MILIMTNSYNNIKCKVAKTTIVVDIWLNSYNGLEDQRIFNQYHQDLICVFSLIFFFHDIALFTLILFILLFSDLNLKVPFHEFFCYIDQFFTLILT